MYVHYVFCCHLAFEDDCARVEKHTKVINYFVHLVLKGVWYLL